MLKIGKFVDPTVVLDFMCIMYEFRIFFCLGAGLIGDIFDKIETGSYFVGWPFGLSIGFDRKNSFILTSLCMCVPCEIPVLDSILETLGSDHMKSQKGVIKEQHLQKVGFGIPKVGFNIFQSHFLGCTFVFLVFRLRCAGVRRSAFGLQQSGYFLLCPNMGDEEQRLGDGKMGITSSSKMMVAP